MYKSAHLMYSNTVAKQENIFGPPYAWRGGTCGGTRQDLAGYQQALCLLYFLRHLMEEPVSKV
jgi:hypothetical protein